MCTKDVTDIEMTARLEKSLRDFAAGKLWIACEGRMGHVW